MEPSESLDSLHCPTCGQDIPTIHCPDCGMVVGLNRHGIIHVHPHRGPHCLASGTLAPIPDDLDGSTAAEVVRFSLDGQQYKITLSADNADLLRKTLRPYIQAGRRADLRQNRKRTRIGQWAPAQAAEG